MRRRWAGLVLALVVPLLAGAVACSKDKGSSTASSLGPSPSSSSTTATTKPGSTVTGPLTGLPLADPVVGLRPALAVKIDNVDTATDVARPQDGIVDADVVFEEIVEGGITRLVAVFQSEVPRRVGPVRSARTTDPMLLAQLDRPLFAWSGGNTGVVQAVHASPLRDMGFDARTSAYARDPSRRAPHNLFVDPAALYAAAPTDAHPPGPLFRYRPAADPLPADAVPASGLDIDFGGPASVSVRYTYNAAGRVWLRSQHGSAHVDGDGHQVAPANVVVLFTDYRPSPADPRSPEAQTVGSGDAWVFTRGSLVGGRWDRPSADRPATLTDTTGAPMLLTPGATWVELARPGQVTSHP